MLRGGRAGEPNTIVELSTPGDGSLLWTFTGPEPPAWTIIQADAPSGDWSPLTVLDGTTTTYPDLATELYYEVFPCTITGEPLGAASNYVFIPS
jgi:hypothetical protein